ncbi:phospholipase A2, group IIE (predicted), isoform CRA_a [Rattus norvegicus]|nr:phospholipase A2, group IIE (predicted), isoform CRA_a [Rattus norvegicus]EDL80893.1 phospholipase A2, group IIE (predicted), isoform CRA_a [Rattus norvegicus]|eukprot:NP_001100166.1 group IIE secretory phospholipase A2 [Rattus norvegicus]
MTAAMAAWRSWAVIPNWKSTSSLSPGTPSSVLVERLASGRPVSVTRELPSAFATTWALITASMLTTPTNCALGPPHPAEVLLRSIANPPTPRLLPSQTWRSSESIFLSCKPILPLRDGGPGSPASRATPGLPDQLKEPRDSTALTRP